MSGSFSGNWSQVERETEGGVRRHEFLTVRAHGTDGSTVLHPSCSLLPGHRPHLRHRRVSKGAGCLLHSDHAPATEGSFVLSRELTGQRAGARRAAALPCEGRCRQAPLRWLLRSGSAVRVAHPAAGAGPPLASVALFLASDDSSYVNGLELVVAARTTWPPPSALGRDGSMGEGGQAVNDARRKTSAIIG
jgi:hypothetical protein